ncbi:MAG TPA: serine/threonine-protein kinase [Pyrinomonadaceae bacterium]|jgi:serine/threonine protein kinase|nr:serine/threonine-protein kinase [Pyrinomonadaceae bacterium]
MAKIYGDRWEIIRSLAEGGQAHTFLVRDLKGDGEIHYVIKRLKNINRLERFKREIEAIRNLSHENIVRLIDFDLEAKEPYLVSEFCSGGSLSDAQSFWQNSPSKAFAIFHEVCEGVAYAHDHNIIHRDIKPDNIFLRTNDGPAVVGDFGICYVEDDGSRLTITEEAVGPRQFIAPELEDGRLDKISSKSDTYSLGKLLYWLFSGGKMFSREKHRMLEWDLKGRNDDSALEWNNIYMEHVNRLLDLMIVNEPENRRSVRTILRVSKKIAKLVEKEFSPISKDIPHPCKYCGYGIYKLQVKTIRNVSSFGLNLVGDPDWRIFTCDFCGHVQMFRVDLANKREWWD